MRQLLHYCWMGPACASNLETCGHDLMGPKAMLQYVESNISIHFWCLEEYAAQYRELLGKTTIQVRTAEALFELYARDSLIARAKKLKEKLLSESRGTPKEYQRLKDLMSLVVLYVEGGYAFDTNVIPVSQTVMHFPHYPTFHMSAIHYPVKKIRDMDAWGMYSPPNNSCHIKEALEFFLDQLEAIESKREIGVAAGVFNFEAYKFSLLDLIIDAPSRNRTQLDFWFVRHLGENFPVRLRGEGFNVIKHYSNSHGATDRRVIPALHLAVSQGDFHKVIELLNDDAIDINARYETDKFKNITAYNVAIFYGHEEIARTLLAHGADTAIDLLPLHFACRGVRSFQLPAVSESSEMTKELSSQMRM